MSNNKLKMNYRSEIDGLRAVAVLAVVLFHAGATPLSGGYIGVDIFFVISGYLISRIILADLAKNTFSLKQFYFRRIKRIFPAYLLVLLSVTLFGLFFSFPYQYLDYGKELSVASTFVSNFYYMFQQGYFEKQSADHLLLHTWSLSVEEQFYVFFPLILMVLAHKKIYVQSVAIVIIALISFAVCIHLTSFYNPLTRFWEFLVGTGVAILDARQLRSLLLRNLLAVLGLSMVIYAIFSFNSHILHPGVLTIIPVVGTGLVLFSASRETLIGRLLSIAPARFFGKISYSLYLWHWPIMVLYTDYFGGSLSRLQMLVYVLICSAIAYLSFVFVEEPVRRQSSKKIRFVMISNLGFMSMMLVFAIFVIQENGLPGRFNQKINKITSIAKSKQPGSQPCLVMPYQPKVDEKKCLPISLDKKQVMVLGDSFAEHLESGLLEYARSFTLLRGFTTGCRPLVSPYGTDSCRKRTQWFLEKFIPVRKLDVVVLAGHWHAYDAEFLAPTIAKIVATGAKVAVLGPLPEYGSDLPRLIARSLLFEDESWIVPGQDILNIERKMRFATEKTDAIYISLNDLVCPVNECQHVDSTGMPLRYDCELTAA